MCHLGVSHPGRAGPWVGAEEKKTRPHEEDGLVLQTVAPCV